MFERWLLRNESVEVAGSTVTLVNHASNVLKIGKKSTLFPLFCGRQVAA
jgi:hypothetical protein